MKNLNFTNIKETAKTVTITILVTGIVAFIGGIKYEQSNTGRVEAQAQVLLHSVPTAQAASKN